MILIITQNFPPDVGGIQGYVAGLADALHAHGHPVEVWCRTTKRQGGEAFDASRGYRVRRFGGPRVWRQFVTRLAVEARLKRGDVTAMITDTWKSLEPLPASALKGIRVVCLAHGNEFLAEGTRKVGRVRRAVAKADVVAANSRFTADIASRFGGRSEVIMPGVVAMPDVIASATAGRRLVTIARLEPRKGVDQAIRAVADLSTTYPDLTLDIGGDGADRARLEALASELGVQDRVHFHGRIDDVTKAKLLSEATLFVLPNRRERGSVEGFGLVFLEAAAFGVPAIAGKDGGAGDAVLDGETGLLVDGDSTQAVTQAVARLLADEDLRRAMGEKARLRFRTDFVWSAAVTRFEKVLGL